MQTTKISDLVKHTDGVWARHPADDIDGFITSRFYDSIKANQDSPVLNPEFKTLANNFEDLLQLSPLRANVFRAFDWDSKCKVLEIGCGAGIVTSFLSHKNLKIDAIESDRALAQLAAIRTHDKESARIISEPFATLDFEFNRYDLIILCGSAEFLSNLSDHQHKKSGQAVPDVITACKALLNGQGQLFLAVENPYAVNYLFAAADQSRSNSNTNFNAINIEAVDQSFNLNTWRELLTGSFNRINEYYLFPDIYFPRVLLNKSYVDTNIYAYQHLDSMHSKNHYQSSAMALNELLLYQVANKNGYMGEVANGCLFTLTNNSEPQINQLDFAHLPNFNRRLEFGSVVLKKTRDNEIKRLSLIDNQESINTKIKQTFEPEHYFSGSQLSVQWRNSFLVDPRGVKFEQYLLAYFAFVKKLDAGVIPGMNIDAIANNIIVDANGEYHLIDREWQLASEKIKSDYVFYRAMVHFALRNSSILQEFKWINGLATLGDFLIYCFKIIGLDLSIGELEPFRIMDCKFLSDVMRESKGYSLSDPLAIEVKIGSALTYIGWRYYNEHYNSHQKMLCTARISNENQTLIFRLSNSDENGLENKAIECFRFFPFEHLISTDADFFSINRVAARIIDEHGNKHDLLKLDNSDDVNRANIHQGMFYGKKQDQHVFMFNSNDTFLEFNLPHYESAIALQIEIDFRLVASHDYEIARHQYALAQREIDTILQIKNQEIELLQEDLSEITQAHDEIKSSRVWRLLVAYRDSFKIGGYPRKNFLAKLGHMIRLFRDPR